MVDVVDFVYLVDDEVHGNIIMASFDEVVERLPVLEDVVILEDLRVGGREAFFEEAFVVHGNFFEKLLLANEVRQVYGYLEDSAELLLKQ